MHDFNVMSLIGLDRVGSERLRHQRAASWAARQFDRIALRGLRHLFLRRGVPYMSAHELERSFAMLQCYCGPAVLADPERLLSPADRVPDLEVMGRRSIPGGWFLHYAFPTPYRPVHPVYHAEYRKFDRLQTVHLYAWQHARPAPATMLLTHGWGGGHPWLHRHEFGVDYMFRELGLDVFLYVAPFHGLRRPSVARFSGELHPSPNLMRTNETFVQTAREIRTAISAILAANPAPIGMMGSSLGGYTAAWIASLDERLSFVVPVLPPSSLADLFWAHGKQDPVRNRVEAMGMTLERFRDAWSLHCPLTYRPKVPWEGRLLVSARGDGLVDIEHTEALWRHWGYPRHVHFEGGHLLQFGRGSYHREVGRMLGRLGLVRARHA